jgi:predicted DNA-binding WGR domain protein
VTVRYGRIGGDGQVKKKSLADEEAARSHLGDLIDEKLGKGYRELGKG